MRSDDDHRWTPEPDGKLHLLEATPEGFPVLSEAQMLNRSTCWPDGFDAEVDATDCK